MAKLRERSTHVLDPGKEDPRLDTASAAVAADAMTELLGDIAACLAPGMRQIEWAEDEIARACAKHPTHADALFHAFRLLQPPEDMRMRTEFVFRSHCRELLQRVVEGGDTRRPTNAELVVACSEISKRVPPAPAHFAVYMRAWLAAFPDKAQLFADSVDPYEHVAGWKADELELRYRNSLVAKDRAPGKVSCGGRHHGKPAPTCRYYVPELVQATGRTIAAGGDQ